MFTVNVILDDGELPTLAYCSGANFVHHMEGIVQSFIAKQ